MPPRESENGGEGNMSVLLFENHFFRVEESGEHFVWTTKTEDKGALTATKAEIHTHLKQLAEVATEACADEVTLRMAMGAAVDLLEQEEYDDPVILAAIDILKEAVAEVQS